MNTTAAVVAVDNWNSFVVAAAVAVVANNELFASRLLRPYLV